MTAAARHVYREGGLLAFFRVNTLEQVPFASEDALRALPLSQLSRVHRMHCSRADRRAPDSIACTAAAQMVALQGASDAQQPDEW